MTTVGIVLDTNILLSGIAYPSSVPGRIVSAWRGGSLLVVLSPYIIAELRRVLPRLQNRHGLTPSEMDDLTEILALEAEMVEPSPIDESRLRDNHDLPVLATLVAATLSLKATILVTGDKDLLALSDQYSIYSAADFWAKYGGLTSDD